ncbi:MAG: hypothetical protein HRO68_09010 [Nitrosopumilus sp.]|nr:hypothetical protein [Nitrosopumilus sp.]
MYVSIDPNLLLISGTDHFYLEIFSVILASVVSVYCIIRGFAVRDKFSFFLGLGFFAAVIIDGLHGFFPFLI